MTRVLYLNPSNVDSGVQLIRWFRSMPYHQPSEGFFMKLNRILSFVLIALLSVALPLSAQTKSKSTKASAPAAAAKSTATPAPKANTLIDLNTATKADLMALPGIADA